jgi:transposase
MAYITHKKINDKTYYYAEQRVWKDGKSKRAWQKYLGTIEKIIESVDGKNIEPDHAILFELGGLAAYLNIAEEIGLVNTIDSMLPKRKQSLTIGQYMLIAAINRGLGAVSKRSIWNWFQNTILLNYFVGVKKEQLTSQRFWDHMDKIPEDMIMGLWKNILESAFKHIDDDLSQISYDETNYYTFISSFNNKCQIAKRGKNKQGRANLRQVNYALFCSNQTHIPLYFDVYHGNCHDSKEFNTIIPKFRETFKNKVSANSPITLIFDKGNNSPDNISLIGQSGFHFVGSLKLNDHTELAGLSNKDKCFVQLAHPKLEQIKAYRLTKQIYSNEMVLIVTFNDKLYQDQIKTVNNDVEKCVQQLSELQQRLGDRADGLITKGKKPTRDSVNKNIRDILKRQYMQQLFVIGDKEKNGIPLFKYEFNGEAYAKLLDTYLGKKILFTDNHHWKTEDIILAYHSQFIIENIFKESKDRNTGCWWPLNHWTDQKIKVHGLYCTITLLIRAIMNHKLQNALMKLSTNRLHQKLDGIKQVINIHSKSKGKGNKKVLKTSTLTKMDEIQQKLYDLFEMKKYMTN